MFQGNFNTILEFFKNCVGLLGTEEFAPQSLSHEPWNDHLFLFHTRVHAFFIRTTFIRNTRLRFSQTIRTTYETKQAESSTKLKKCNMKTIEP